ncbi:MAG: N-6 DNA methylase [Nitrosomonadales bacterium]|nr:N-6 DNA methylase [Nitrosomonadales bacterium]
MTAGRKIVSNSQDWCTPPRYVEAVKRFFGGSIELDPCSNKHSIVKARVEHRLPKVDGLHVSWDCSTIYVNPPYGADRSRGTTIKHWLRKCFEAHQLHNSEVLALIPVATNTSHWKHFVWGAASGIAFLYDTRLKFLVDGKDGGKGAPMSCAMVYWGRHLHRFDDVFSTFGAVVDISKLKGRRFGYGDDPQQQIQLVPRRKAV